MKSKVIVVLGFLLMFGALLATLFSSAPVQAQGKEAYATFTPITFSDVHPSDYFYGGVSYLAAKGALSGYSDGTFRPYNSTTRGQAAKIMVLGFDWVPLLNPTTPTFSDVPASSPFYTYVETAYAREALNGYDDGTFRPEATVTRGQFTKILIAGYRPELVETVQSFVDVPSTNPFYLYIEAAYDRRIIGGYTREDGTREFRPNAELTRGQVATIVMRTVCADLCK